ncbi:hypothetical protein [Brachybacterium sacelli]|uniref:hypothetical protein n=1 Tax=Brachybacterium sacelli TaxID=173364 RepID=UPI003622BAFE
MTCDDAATRRTSSSRRRALDSVEKRSENDARTPPADGLPRHRELGSRHPLRGAFRGVQNYPQQACSGRESAHPGRAVPRLPAVSRTTFGPYER